MGNFSKNYILQLINFSLFELQIERLEKERDAARADVERLIEERDALRERLKVILRDIA